MQVPPERASTVHSVAIGGEPGPKPSLSAANRCGGSHAVFFATTSMPGPKCEATVPSSRSSVGMNQDETPGPVAMACQTSSGVPGTSTSAWTYLRPEGSFFTLMMTPWYEIYGVEGAPRLPVDARGRWGRKHRDNSRQFLLWLKRGRC